MATRRCRPGIDSASAQRTHTPDRPGALARVRSAVRPDTKEAVQSCPTDGIEARRAQCERVFPDPSGRTGAPSLPCGRRVPRNTVPTRPVPEPGVCWGLSVAFRSCGRGAAASRAGVQAQRIRCLPGRCPCRRVLRPASPACGPPREAPRRFGEEPCSRWGRVRCRGLPSPGSCSVTRTAGRKSARSLASWPRKAQMAAALTIGSLGSPWGRGAADVRNARDPGARVLEQPAQATGAPARS